MVVVLKAPAAARPRQPQGPGSREGPGSRKAPAAGKTPAAARPRQPGFNARKSSQMLDETHTHPRRHRRHRPREAPAAGLQYRAFSVLAVFGGGGFGYHLVSDPTPPLHITILQLGPAIDSAGRWDGAQRQLLRLSDDN